MNLSKRLMLVLADFLEDVADAQSAGLSIGRFGPDEPYRKKESKQIGPALRECGAEGLIFRTDTAAKSIRPSRKGGTEWCWFPQCRDGCRRKAEGLRQRANTLDDDGKDLKQATLF